MHLILGVTLTTVKDGRWYICWLNVVVETEREMLGGKEESRDGRGGIGCRKGGMD